MQYICDFCSDPHVRWSYPARDFVDLRTSGVTGVIVSESIGAWAACEECHVLIEAGEHEALLLRSVQKFIELYGIVLPGLVEDTGRIHSRFFAHRCGPAVRVVGISQLRR